MRERNIELGKLAISRGLVSRQAVSDVFKALPPDTPIEQVLVARGVLKAGDAASLARELSSASDATMAGGLAKSAAPPSGPRPSGELPAPGDAIGDYEIQKLLGKGGMGAVYKAVHRRTRAEAAIKVVLDAEAEDSMLERFKRESEAMAKVDRHAGVVRIRASGTWGSRGLPYAVMDFVQGHDLAREVKDGPLPLERALTVVAKVARAIHHCHEQGILHRDLKPANILIREEDDEPLVTDFGLARDETKERLTKTGEALGTPAFMAPEQAEGLSKEHDKRTDVYGLGAILYQCLTGKPPFEADSHIALIKKVLLEDPVEPSKVNPAVPRDASAIASIALAKEKQHRFATALEVADELERAARGEHIHARPPSGFEKWRRRARRNPRIVLGWALIPLVIGGGAVAITVYQVREQRRRDRLEALTRVVGETQALLTDVGVPALPLDARDKDRVLAAREKCRKARDELGEDTAPYRRVMHWIDLFDAPNAFDAAAPEAADAAAAVRVIHENRSHKDARDLVDRFASSSASGDAAAKLALAMAELEEHGPTELPRVVAVAPPSGWGAAVASAVTSVLGPAIDRAERDATDGKSVKGLEQLATTLSVPLAPQVARPLARWLGSRRTSLTKIARGLDHLDASVQVKRIVRSVRISANETDPDEALDEVERVTGQTLAESIKAISIHPRWDILEQSARALWPQVDPADALDLATLGSLEKLIVALGGLDTTNKRGVNVRAELFALGIMHGFILTEYIQRIPLESYANTVLEKTFPDSLGTENHRKRRAIEKELAALLAYFECYDPIFEFTSWGEREVNEKLREECRKDAENRRLTTRLDDVRRELEDETIWKDCPKQRSFLRALERYAWGLELGRVIPFKTGEPIPDGEGPVREKIEAAQEKAYREALELGHPRWVVVARRLLVLLAARAEHDSRSNDKEKVRADVKAVNEVAEWSRVRFDATKKDLTKLVEREGDPEAQAELTRRRMNGEYVAAADEDLLANTYFTENWAWMSGEKVGLEGAHAKRREALEKGLAIAPHRGWELLDYADVLEQDGKFPEALGKVEQALGESGPSALRGGSERNRAETQRTRLKAKIEGH